jgi:7,8-dihydropterin-6-yl-methyl-4-(beta-D-ribofuranosyl)aminobenzene 5'-phosphate synthase
LAEESKLSHRTGQSIDIPKHGIKATILLDDKDPPDILAEKGFESKHGLSIFLEVRGKTKILFDVGQAGLFLQNAGLVGIDLKNKDYTLVLSHRHFDHTGGIKYLPDGLPAICHPDVFKEDCWKIQVDGVNYEVEEKYKGKIDLLKQATRGLVEKVWNGPPEEIGLEEAKKKFKLTTTNEPYYFPENKNIIFLGEIPKTNDFEEIRTEFTNAEGFPEFIREESALAIKTTEGLAIITGCSHPGICNTIEYAKKVTGINKIRAVLGGFHLLPGVDTDVLEKTKAYFARQNLQHLYPIHCISDTVKEDISDAPGIGTGSEIII